MLRLLLCLPLLFCLPAHGSSFLVGNAAEAVKLGDRVFLRDLYEYNLHASPSFGSRIDLSISKNLVFPKILTSKIARRLLLLKLSDLNRIAPDLGVYATEAINHYHWLLVDTELLPFPDDGSALHFTRFPLANRFQDTIRVQREYWQLMNEQNQVAMILHEALGSLTKADCTTSGCNQAGHKVREMTARAFLADEERAWPAHMEEWLSIPARYLRSSCSEQRRLHMPTGDIFIEIGERLRLPPLQSTRGLEMTLRKTCAEHSEQIEALELHRRPFVKKVLAYETGELPGRTYLQSQLAFIHVPGSKKIRLEGRLASLTPNECASLMIEFIQEWFSYAASTLAQDPMNACRAREVSGN